MKTIKNIVICLLVVAISLGCTNRKPWQSGEHEIVILHVNDLHAHLDNLPKLAALIKEERAANPNIILVSAGDIFSGNPYIDFAAEKGQPYIEMLNKLGVIVHTTGNHEFDYGQETLNKRREEAQFPFLLANSTNDSSILKPFQPHFSYTFPALDFSIAFVGLLENYANGRPSTQPRNVSGLSFTSGVETMGDYLGLKDQHDILIALSHLGSDDDLKLARTYPALDIIIGGHSHTVIDPAIIENNVLLAQAGAYGKYLGKISIKLSNGKIASKSGVLVPLADYPNIDAEFAQMIENLQNDQHFNREITKLKAEINGKDCLGAMITDAYRYATGAEIAIQNAGGIRVSSLPAGPIRVKDILTMDPFSNELVKFQLSGKEILSLLTPPSKVRKYTELLVSGMKYQLQADREGNVLGISATFEDGSPLQADRKYSVVTNSYVASTYEFEHEDEGTTLYMLTSEATMEYLENNKDLTIENCDRTVIVVNPK